MSRLVDTEKLPSAYREIHWHLYESDMRETVECLRHLSHLMERAMERQKVLRQQEQERTVG